MFENVKFPPHQQSASVRPAAEDEPLTVAAILVMGLGENLTPSIIKESYGRTENVL